MFFANIRPLLRRFVLTLYASKQAGGKVHFLPVIKKSEKNFPQHFSTPDHFYKRAERIDPRFWDPEEQRQYGERKAENVLLFLNDCITKRRFNIETPTKNFAISL